MQTKSATASQIQEFSPELSSWRFAISQGSWGPLLCGYYEAGRTALPNELEFWASIVQPTSTIIEIGSGSGFISRALAEAEPMALTLVEPEREHVKLLRRTLPDWKTRTQLNIVQSSFETCRLSPHNLVVFPYDSLPMIASRKQRAKLYQNVYDHLVPGGSFVIHFSTSQWIQNYLKETTHESICDLKISTGEEVKVRRFSQRVSDAEFIKFVLVECAQTQSRERYIALTAILSETEVIEDAANAGLILIERYSDFCGGKDKHGDEVIFVFKREK